VTVSINRHPETLGLHRVRLSFDPAVAKVLRHGLAFPRLHIDGTVINGLRIWCDEAGGMAPAWAKSGAWAVTVPVRRLRGREQVVPAMPTKIIWERDETGPVLLLPRLPDALLPEEVIAKLPNSQVDRDTIMERAEKRLTRELQVLNNWEIPLPQGQPAFIDSAKDSLIEPVEPPTVEPPTVEPPSIEPPKINTVPPPSNDAADLREAIQMVNELVERLGDEVVLSIDAEGRVQAKRRIVAFIDL
jgi:hypothetical protein